jgi:hypothetical protein
MKGSCSFKHIELIVMVSFLLHILVADNAFGLPCKGRTVNIGETMNEVTAKCGEAIMKDRRTVKVEETDEEGTITTTSTIIDEWTYDSGPEELLQSYRFEKGKLKEISSNGYGTVRDFSIDTCRNGESLAIGDSTVETYLKCGDPLAKERREDKVIESEDGLTKRRTFLTVVEWTYRYGPNAPGYTVTFEDGVAAKIRTREFGK